MGDVVDQQFSVYGVQNLQVVDASVLPLLTTGNSNAMVMTIAKMWRSACTSWLAPSSQSAAWWASATNVSKNANSA